MSLNSFHLHGNFVNSEMNDYKADTKLTVSAQTGGRHSFCLCVRVCVFVCVRACVCVCVCCVCVCAYVCVDVFLLMYFFMN